jgi:membrane associated rhomboid family serine protease
MQEREEGVRFRRSINYTFSFVLLIWLVKIIEISLDLDFGSFGILPRTLEGSVGIFVAPLIHGDIYHLLSNTFPVIILGVGLFYFYDRIAITVVVLIYLMTGFWVWLAARDAYHIGASGIVYGLLTFLLFSGFFRKDARTLAISFVILVLYGGSFIYGIIPTRPGISWESHLMGGIAGLFAAIYFKKTDIVNSHIDQPSKPEDKEAKYNYTYILKAPEENNEHEKYQYKINIERNDDELSNTC